jgi:hypothetical protein
MPTKPQAPVMVRAMGTIRTLSLALAAMAAPSALAAPAQAAAPLQPLRFSHSIDLRVTPAAATRGFTPFVIGGGPALDGTLPSTAYIQVTTTDGASVACTGSVIAPTFVVTAAHCFVSDAEVQSVAVAMGAHDLTQLPVGVGQAIAGAHVEIDPDYDPGSAAHDAAVVTLATPTAAPPVPLATAEEIKLLGPGTPLTVAGWGLTTTGNSGPTPTQLQTGTVELQDARYCEATLGKINVFDPRLWLCTDTPSHAVGTCHGDSGGPLLWTNAAGVVELIGLTDWGFDGCDPPITAYTNLATVGPWVLYAAGLGAQPPRDATGARGGTVPRPAHRPHISGTAAPGGLLTCHLGSWKNQPTSFDVDWLYNGRKVPGVHTTRVRLAKTVSGGWARCAVTARNAAGRAKSSSKGVHVRQPARSAVKPG